MSKIIILVARKFIWAHKLLGLLILLVHLLSMLKLLILIENSLKICKRMIMFLLLVLLSKSSNQDFMIPVHNVIRKSKIVVMVITVQLIIKLLLFLKQY